MSLLLPIIDLQDVKTKLLDLEPSFPGLVVATADERELKLSWGTEYPAIYLLKQNAVSTTPGNAAGRVIRQLYNVQLDLCILTRRFEDGLAVSTMKQSLSDAVYNLLIGWTPPRCDMGLDLLSYVDGDPSDPVQYALHKYHTRVLKQGVLS